MRQIRIVRNYNGALGRYFRGICVLRAEEVASQLVQDGYAEYVDGGVKERDQKDLTSQPDLTPQPPLPEGEGEQVPPEGAVRMAGENAMRPKANSKKANA